MDLLRPSVFLELDGAHCGDQARHPLLYGVLRTPDLT